MRVCTVHLATTTHTPKTTIQRALVVLIVKRLGQKLSVWLEAPTTHHTVMHTQHGRCLLASCLCQKGHTSTTRHHTRHLWETPQQEGCCHARRCPITKASVGHSTAELVGAAFMCTPTTASHQQSVTGTSRGSTHHLIHHLMHTHVKKHHPPETTAIILLTTPPKTPQLLPQGETGTASLAPCMRLA